MPTDNWKDLQIQHEKAEERFKKQWRDGKVVHPLEGDVDGSVRQMLEKEQSTSGEQKK